MNYSRLFNWVDRKLSINKRLKEVAILYVLFLIVSFRKHSLQEAARFSNSSKSRFSKLLKNHPDMAIVKLEELSKKQAKQFGSNIRFLQDGKLPWKTAAFNGGRAVLSDRLLGESAKNQAVFGA